MKKTRIKAKDLIQGLKDYYSFGLSKKDKVEVWEDRDKNLKIYVVNDEPSFFFHNERLVPTLRLLQKDSSLLKEVVVDMGAVKFVVSGADIMRPGIVSFAETILVDDFVVILDVDNKKPLAIGIIKNSSSELNVINKGKVVKSIHFIGDDLWKLG